MQVGEELCTCKKHGGQKKWTKFYTWGHVERDTMAEFIKFKIGQDGLKELNISSEHLIFVAAKNGNKVVKKAGQVCIGKKLQL